MTTHTNALATSAPSPWRRTVLAALAIAMVAALAALGGPPWMVRIGLVVAAATGLVAAILAVRSLRSLDGEHRRSKGEHLIRIDREHGTQLREERSRNSSVLDTLSAAIRRRDEVAAELRTALAAERQAVTAQQRVNGDQAEQIGALQADLADLRGELERSNATIDSLRLTLAIREEELAALLGSDDSAEVYAMPRRVLTSGSGNDGGSGHDGEAAEPVDLAMMQTISPPKPEIRKQA
ncbi:hypothetical protein [Microlunatus sp. Y2014]|uniref:hypothetical protein n=1 Tax=Microlunatus sp. Y2014 TaxID=3418488 RepID=UPI003DA79673